MDLIVKQEPQDSDIDMEQPDYLKAKEMMIKIETEIKPEPEVLLETKHEKGNQEENYCKQENHDIDEPKNIKNELDSTTQQPVKHLHQSQIQDNVYSQNEEENFNTKSDIKYVVKSKITDKNTAGKPHQCEICNKVFCSSSNLLRHKAFFSSSKMLSHKITHTGEKRYKCETCDKSFHQKGSLVAHKRTHTGEKPYKCEICDKDFCQKGKLVRHRRIHTGEKPYKCETCNKAFNQKEYLMIHQRTHTGEKPYKCDICNETFTWKGSLKVHKGTHRATREKPY